MAKKKKSSWEEAKRGKLSIVQQLFKSLVSGVFQNIHDSFDEIDSKSLYPFYQKNQQQTNLGSNGKYLWGPAIGGLKNRNFVGDLFWCLSWPEMFYVRFVPVLVVIYILRPIMI